MKISLFHLDFWNIFSLDIESQVGSFFVCFSSQYSIKMMFHCLLISIVSDEKLTNLFFSVQFSLSLSLDALTLYPLFLAICWWSCLWFSRLSEPVVVFVFVYFVKCLISSSSNIISALPCSPSSSRTPITCVLDLFVLSHRSQMICLIF